MASTYPATLDNLIVQDVDNPDVVNSVNTMQAVHQRDKTVLAVQTPAAAGTVTPNMQLGSYWPIQMPAGNITIANPTNGQAGDILTLKITEDGVGTRTVTLGAAYKRAGGAYTLTTTAGASDILSFRFDGTNWNEIGRAAAIA